MTLTDRQAVDLEMEFLQADLGRLPAEMPVTTIKRELTRALYERPTAQAQEVISWVVGALDKVVTAWEAWTVVSKAQPQVVDGVRTAAAFIAEAAERAGLTVPVQPAPPPQYAIEPADGAEPGPAAAPPWTPSDGGRTPSKFGGI